MSAILSKSSYVLGIDLGTSTTIASVFSKGKKRRILFCNRSINT